MVPNPQKDPLQSIELSIQITTILASLRLKIGDYYTFIEFEVLKQTFGKKEVWNKLISWFKKIFKQ